MSDKTSKRKVIGILTLPNGNRQAFTGGSVQEVLDRWLKTSAEFRGELNIYPAPSGNGQPKGAENV